MPTHPQTKGPTKRQKRLAARIASFDNRFILAGAPEMHKPGSQNHKK